MELSVDDSATVWNLNPKDTTRGWRVWETEGVSLSIIPSSLSVICTVFTYVYKLWVVQISAKCSHKDQKKLFWERDSTTLSSIRLFVSKVDFLSWLSRSLTENLTVMTEFGFYKGTGTRSLSLVVYCVYPSTTYKIVQSLKRTKSE